MNSPLAADEHNYQFGVFPSRLLSRYFNTYIHTYRNTIFWFMYLVMYIHRTMLHTANLLFKFKHKHEGLCYANIEIAFSIFLTPYFEIYIYRNVSKYKVPIYLSPSFPPYSLLYKPWHIYQN